MSNDPPGQQNLIEFRLNAIYSELSQMRLEISHVLDDHEARLRAVTSDVTRLQERQNFITGGLAGLQIILSSVAAWIGLQK